MLSIQFKDETHKTFFFDAMLSRNISFKDTERAALFYVLGLSDITRERIDSFYDNAIGGIRPEVLHDPFQTSGTLALTRLAFSLYNGFVEEKPCLLDDITLFNAVSVPLDEFEQTYEYTDTPYGHYFPEKPYFMAKRPIGILDYFCYVDRELVPFLFEAIKLRLNLVNLI